MKTIDLESFIISMIFFEKIDIHGFKFKKEMFKDAMNFKYVNYLYENFSKTNKTLFQLNQPFIAKNDLKIYELKFVDNFLVKYEPLTLLDAFFRKSIEYIWDQRKLDNTSNSSLDETLEIITEMKKKIEDISINKKTKNPFDSFRDNLEKLKTSYENGEVEEGIIGIRSDIEQLDILSGGFKDGEYTLLAGRPSMGKTSLALDIAISAIKENKRVYVLSLEMTSEQLIARAIPKINNTLTLNNTVNGVDLSFRYDDIIEASKFLERSSLFIEDFEDENLVTLNVINSKIEKFFKDHGFYPDMIILDYIQLVKADKNVSENDHITNVSNAIQRNCKRMKNSFIALSQLNRGLEERADKRPMNSDLRGSGSLEQDADKIIFVYRDAVYLEKRLREALSKKPSSSEISEAILNLQANNIDNAEIILSKNRNGKVGTAFTKFYKPCASYTDTPENFSSDAEF